MLLGIAFKTLFLLGVAHATDRCAGLEQYTTDLLLTGYNPYFVYPGEYPDKWNNDNDDNIAISKDPIFVTTCHDIRIYREDGCLRNVWNRNTEKITTSAAEFLEYTTQELPNVQFGKIEESVLKNARLSTAPSAIFVDYSTIEEDVIPPKQTLRGTDEDIKELLAPLYEIYNRNKRAEIIGSRQCLTAELKISAVPNFSDDFLDLVTSLHHAGENKNAPAEKKHDIDLQLWIFFTAIGTHYKSLVEVGVTQLSRISIPRKFLKGEKRASVLKCLKVHNDRLFKGDLHTPLNCPGLGGKIGLLRNITFPNFFGLKSIPERYGGFVKMKLEPIVNLFDDSTFSKMKEQARIRKTYQKFPEQPVTVVQKLLYGLQHYCKIMAGMRMKCGPPMQQKCYMAKGCDDVQVCKDYPHKPHYTQRDSTCCSNPVPKVTESNEKVAEYTCDDRSTVRIPWRDGTPPEGDEKTDKGKDEEEKKIESRRQLLEGPRGTLKKIAGAASHSGAACKYGSQKIEEDSAVTVELICQLRSKPAINVKVRSHPFSSQWDTCLFHKDEACFTTCGHDPPLHAGSVCSDWNVKIEPVLNETQHRRFGNEFSAIMYDLKAVKVGTASVLPTTPAPGQGSTRKTFAQLKVHFVYCVIICVAILSYIP